MVTATPDITEISEATNNDSLVSRINTAVGLDDVATDSNINDIHYYYSAGDFHFVLERGFKPETLESAELTPVPFVPEWHAGIISIHGIIMPVIDVLTFAKKQKLKVKSKKQNKNYLLKLEHPEYRPIVLKLDALPQTINIKKLKSSNDDSLADDKNSPQWIKKYLEDENIKIAFIDHHKLLEKIINSQ